MTLVLFQIAVFLGLLGLSAFFNSAEQAIYGLKGHDIAQLKESRDRSSRRVVALLKHPRRLLISIITGNMLTIIAFGVAGAAVAVDLASVNGWNPVFAILGEVAILSLVLIIVGHITPRILALGNTIEVSRAVSLPIAILYRLFYPLAFVVFRATKFLSRLLGVTKENLFISEEEIRTLVEVSEIQGALQEDEKDMIYSIFEFGETAVREIMIPRIDMIAVPSTMRVNEVIDVIKKHRFSRMPLYEKRVDNITGILYAKDLLPYLDKKATNVESAMLGRPAYFVPEKMKIDKLMREFQQRKTNIAVVVDEYGGTSGLVTLEDIIEEIVGEIRDEYDFEAPLYRWVDSRTLLVNARINLDDLEQVVVLGIEEERDYDTLAGFLYSTVGEIPEENTEIIYNDVKYIIDRIQGNRINRVSIELPAELIGQDEEEGENET